MSIEKAQTWDYGHGTAIVQLVRGIEVDSVVRLWNDHPQAGWNVRKTIHLVGFIEGCFDQFVRQEDWCHSSYEKRIGC